VPADSARQVAHAGIAARKPHGNSRDKPYTAQQAQNHDTSDANIDTRTLNAQG